MHNESKSDRDPQNVVELEPVKPSKLRRIKDTAVTATWIAIPVALSGGLMYASFRMSKMQFETAKMNLEAARLTQLAETAPPQS